LAKLANGVTAYVITHNEEQNLPDCLESLEWCDEVLVVDSFSEDQTCVVAADMGARVVQHEWPGFAAQKQFALSNVRTRWAINLDADERVSPDLQRSIRDVVSRDAAVAGYAFRRTTFHLGRLFRNGNLFERVLRLAQTSRSHWVGENVHERLTIDGPIGWLDGELVHRRNRSLSKQHATLDEYSTYKAREMYARGVRPGAAMLLSHAAMAFFQSYVLRRGFRSGVSGLILALEHSSYNFYKYAKCWELHHAPQVESVANRRKVAAAQRRPRPEPLVAVERVPRIMQR
jgi:glycosyltransferase involved in cell wall biosynthesis